MIVLEARCPRCGHLVGVGMDAVIPYHSRLRSPSILCSASGCRAGLFGDRIGVIARRRERESAARKAVRDLRAAVAALRPRQEGKGIPIDRWQRNPLRVRPVWGRQVAGGLPGLGKRR